VLLVPGGAFNIDSSEPSSYVRASFSLSSPAQMDLVSEIFFLHSYQGSFSHNNAPLFLLTSS